jgi:hypothetical protein
MSFSSFSPRPPLFSLLAYVPSSSSSSLLPLPCPIADRPAGRCTPVQLRPPGHMDLLAPWKIPRWPTKSHSSPQEASTRQHSSAECAAGDSEAATPRFCPLVKPFLEACAQAAILPLVPIKAPPEAPKLAAPTPTPASRHPRMDAPLRPHILQTNLPSLSSPHTKAAQPALAPSSSPERRHHHPHPPPALCHRRQAASVHPLPTQGHKQVRFVPLLPLPPSPLAAGDPCRRKFSRPSPFPSTKYPFASISIFLRRFL